MADIDLTDKERIADDQWTSPKLIILAAVTLVIALTAIWGLGSFFAPPGY